MIGCEVLGQVTLTDDIVVGDGAFGYVASLEGDWTPEQIRAAFADGYDWGGREVTALTIMDPMGNHAVTLAMRVGEDYGRYPHVVEWR